MNFRSVADLADAISRGAPRLPPNLDIIVGLPRSGLLAANLMALTLNLPLADFDGFLAGRTLATGRTRKPLARERSSRLRALVVDDSVNSGHTLREARETATRLLGDTVELFFCAVFGLEATHPDADIILEAVPQPRMFQWNFMHHPWLAHCCVDIDGVLCSDPTKEQNDDGANYLEFLTSARPLHAATQRIGWLVTSRLEKYRPQTEDWLSRNGVHYENLIMLSAASKEERQQNNLHGQFKATAYRDSGALLFIESDYGQAQVIARTAGKAVLCVEAMQIIGPDRFSLLATMQAARTLPRRLRIAPPQRYVRARRALKHALAPLISAVSPHRT